MKKLLAAFLCLVLVLAACGCGGDGAQGSGDKTTINVATLAGPTGMGMAKLMEDNEAGLTAGSYNFTIAGAPDDIAGRITSGEIDIASAPLNLASVLYNKTGGKVQLAALNTLGVIYILEKGESIQSVQDLAGKTIVSAGQGATPEYALNYILEANGLTDSVTVDYKTEHSEVATLLAAGQADVVLLAEPHVTSALNKTEGARIALDLTDEWEKAVEKTGGGKSVLAMSGLIVRREFAENNKEALLSFLKEYKASAEYAASNIDETAALIVKHGIIPSEEVAKSALPNCNIVFISGEEMKELTGNFLQILFDANNASVGGALPGEDFYF